MVAKRPDDDPNKPADRSVASAGELADVPTDITAAVIGDEQGLLLKWDGAEWLYANEKSFVSLGKRE